MIDFHREPIKTDVLIAGGGIAGLMAAISAADQGAEVLVAEKANTKRSGSGATGNDHFSCYIPEVHGDDIDPIIREHESCLQGGYADRALTKTFLEQSFDRVRNWDSWGISMRPHGSWEFMGHAFPGRPRIFLKYAGHNQKEVLTREAKKRGVRIVNHLSVSEVLTDGGEVVGAIGIDTVDEQPVMKLFQAKSIVLAMGCGSRLYPSPSPGLMFNTANCPSNTGSGQAITFRAGAKLVNMEFPSRHAGPKYFARCGKASWIGVYRDPHGKAIGPFVTKPTRELGDITGDVWNSVFTDLFRSGRGPAYIDCSGTSEEDIDYMTWSLKHEGNTAMLQYMEEEGIDVRRHMVEFMQYEPFIVGRGIEIDVNAETSVRGMYSAGDPVGNFRADLSGAAVFGWIAGERAAQRSNNTKGPQNVEAHPLVADRVKFYSEILGRDSGPTWQEANLALQQIMKDYAGLDVRSETLLKAGLKYLRDLKQSVISTLMAENSHTLMRSLEILDLMDCGEIIFLAALERKETRAMHRRADLPFTNPLLQDKFLTIRRENNKIELRWRDKN